MCERWARWEGKATADGMAQLRVGVNSLGRNVRELCERIRADWWMQVWAVRVGDVVGWVVGKVGTLNRRYCISQPMTKLARLTRDMMEGVACADEKLLESCTFATIS